MKRDKILIILIAIIVLAKLSFNYTYFERKKPVTNKTNNMNTKALYEDMKNIDPGSVTGTQNIAIGYPVLNSIYQKPVDTGLNHYEYNSTSKNIHGRNMIWYIDWKESLLEKIKRILKQYNLKKDCVEIIIKISLICEN